MALYGLSMLDAQLSAGFHMLGPHMLYCLNGGSNQSYGTPIQLTVEGKTTAAYHSADLAGNVEAVQTETAKLDSVPPCTTATMELAAADATSGVATTQYRINPGAWQTYPIPFEVGLCDTTTVGYRSIDVAGNLEAKMTITIPPSESCTNYLYPPLVLRNW